MYTTTRHEASISVPEYVENYVDVPTFLEACKACPNYDRVWACPSYDFDVLKYWKQYQTFQLLATEITFDEDMLAKEYSRQEIQDILDQVLPPEKKKLSDELLRAEKLNPGSISLSAGSCHLCKDGCTKPHRRLLPQSGSDALLHRIPGRQRGAYHRKTSGSETGMDRRRPPSPPLCAGMRPAASIIIYSACSKRTFSARRAASRMQSGQERRTLPVFTPFRSWQIIEPFCCSNSSTIFFTSL